MFIYFYFSFDDLPIFRLFCLVFCILNPSKLVYKWKTNYFCRKLVFVYLSTYIVMCSIKKLKEYLSSYFNFNKCFLQNKNEHKLYA